MQIRLSAELVLADIGADIGYTGRHVPRFQGICLYGFGSA